MSRGCLVDLTKCMGCRGCQVACKQWNELPAERTSFFSGYGGYQNPPALSGNTYTLVGYNEFKNGDDIQWIFAKRQCMHCIEPACESACPVAAFHIDDNGAVVYEPNKCMGCRYCMMACPFGIPTFEWGKTIPYIKKCTYCMDRMGGQAPNGNLNDKPLTGEEKASFTKSFQTPACAKACPTGAIKFGDREALLAEANRRITANPHKYVNKVYGETEVGGTRWMYLSAVPFEQLGFPASERVGDKPYPTYTSAALKSVPLVVVGGGAIVGGLYWLYNRKKELQQMEREA